MSIIIAIDLFSFTANRSVKLCADSVKLSETVNISIQMLV
jgi:hypothetical protein